MNKERSTDEGRFAHVVTLDCEDAEHAQPCVEALANNGKPDGLAFDCSSYEFGIREGTADTVCIAERWRRWQDLDALLAEKVVPALPMYKQPFDPARGTVRINLSGPI
jgi:hypothetical protein